MENQILINTVPKAKKPIVSIIIATYNNLYYTLQCLKSINEAKEKTPFEIIIIDDCSTDGDTEKIIPKIKGITYYRVKKNQGFVKNMNIGAKIAKGKYIYLLNNDTKVTNNYLAYLLDVFKKDSNVGVVGSKLVYPDGKLQEAGAHMYTNGKGFNYGKFQDPDDYRFNYVREVDYISGASILIKKEVWDKLNGFDEDFSPGYYEDTDFQFRVKQAGYKVIYQPKSVIIHFEGVTNGKEGEETKGNKKYQILNKSKFVKKHTKYLNEHNFTEDYSQMDNQIFSKNKKHVFVFEDHLPTFDQDAGSLRCLNILKILQTKYQVSLIPHDPYFHNQNDYIKYYEYYTQLGIRVVSNLGSDRKVCANKFLIDNNIVPEAALLFRPEIAIKYINIIKKIKTGTKIIYDPVDLTHLRLNTEINYLQSLSNNCAERINYLKHLALRYKVVDHFLTNRAEEIWVISQEEKQYIVENFNIPENKIKLIPIILDIKPTKKLYGKRMDILFIGSFNHPPNVEAIKYYQNYIVPELERKKIDINLIVIGSNTEKIKKALEIRIASMPKGSGFKKPGSMNKKKTGYAKIGR